MTLNFDLGDLQAFRAVADQSSFRKAAEILHISQPALSRRIEKIEQALGVKLLDRTTRRVNLTAVGHEFSRKAEQVLDHLKNAVLDVRDFSSNRTGNVTIACVPSAVSYFLPQVIARYHERYPGIRIKVFDTNAHDALAAVVNGQADFGLNFMGSQEPGIEFRLLLQERFVAACRHDHPLAGKRRVSWNELARHDCVTVDRNSGNRLLLDQALAGLSVRPQWVCETRHVTTMLGLVEAGLGVAAVPSLAMTFREHPLLTRVPLTDPVVIRRLGLIKRDDQSLSPAAKQLYQLVIEMRPKRGTRSA